MKEKVLAEERVRTAENGCSMEEKSRLILRDAVGCKPSSGNFWSKMRAFVLMRQLLPHDLFALLSFDEQNLVIPFTRVGRGL